VDNLVSCSMVELLQHADLGLLHRDHRGVRFQHRGQQVALRGDLLVDQGQVVVHVMQVGQQLFGHASFDGGDDRQQRVHRPIEIGDLAAQEIDPFGRRDGAGEHRRFQLLDIPFDHELGIADNLRK
jgi:hypothetical protein